MGKINFLKEYFKIAVKSLRARRLRSWLTIVGVVIGIFLIVSLMSLSEGLKGAVMQQLRMMGKDLITIMPGDISDIMASIIGGQELTDDDIRTIKRTEGIDFVVAINYTSGVMRYNNQKKTVLINGNDWKEALNIYINDMGWSLSEGRWPTPGKYELIAGNLVSKEIFPGMKVGDEATIKGRTFKIVGIMNSVGSKQDDSMVNIDLNVFKNITGERTGAKMALAKVKPGYSTDKVVDNLKQNLNESKKRMAGQKESDSSYAVLSSEKIASIVGNVMGLIQAVIIGFASISIVVGGIGIMNTMYTSVRERIKEIGIMKAIGAKNSTINTIFLIESGIFGVIGGLGGTLLGFIFAKAIEIYFQIHPLLYLKADVSPQLVFFSLFFSFLVGCISGFLPARSASKLNPVDALRYE